MAKLNSCWFKMIILILCVTIKPAWGQNYLTNGDFEDFDCENQNPNVFNWFSESGSIIGFNSCLFISSVHSAPSNDYGWQHAQSGNGYALLQAYCSDEIEPGFTSRAYISNQLNEGLWPDSIYYCSFYVSALNGFYFEGAGYNNGFISNIGARFSADGNVDPVYNQEVSSDIESADGFILNDSINWIKIEGVFQPAEFCDFITIGCFHTDDEITTLQNPEVDYDLAICAGYYIDNIQIQQADPIYYTLDLGPDTLICYDNTNPGFVLTAPIGFDSYLWSNGSQGTSIEIFENGTYWVEVNAGMGSIRDSMSITFQTIPEYTALQDLTICGLTEGVWIDAPDLFESYAWNVGGNDDSLYVLPSPIPIEYILYADVSCLSIIDTFLVSFVDEPAPPFTENLNYCLGDTPAPLEAEGDNLLWYIDTLNSGIEYAPIPSTNSVGSYYYFVTQSNAFCESIFTLIEIQVNGPPILSLGNDTLLCYDSPLLLGDSLWPYSIIWNTGDTTSTLLVEGTDLYSLHASNNCGTFSDTIAIEFIACNSYVFVPSAFTPNGDGVNDTFFAFADNVTGLEVIVYNRFGDAIFYTNKNESWDGTLNDEVCGDDVYNYRITYLDFQNVQHTETGHVVLLR